MTDCAFRHKLYDSSVMTALATRPRVCPDCRRPFSPQAIDSEVCPVCESLQHLTTLSDRDGTAGSGRTTPSEEEEVDAASDRSGTGWDIRR